MLTKSGLVPRSGLGAARSHLSLTLEPWIVKDSSGEEIELERPSKLCLEDCAVPTLQLFADVKWTELQAARATPLFETPIAHFLVWASQSPRTRDEVIVDLLDKGAAFRSA